MTYRLTVHRRYGLEVYRVVLLRAGRVCARAEFMSEHGALTWLRARVRSET